MKAKVSVSRDSEFVDQAVPSTAALSVSSVVLSAYIEALDSLMLLSNSGSSTDTIKTAMYQNFVALKAVRDRIDTDLAKADVMHAIIEARLGAL